MAYQFHSPEFTPRNQITQPFPTSSSGKISPWGQMVLLFGSAAMPLDGMAHVNRLTFARGWQIFPDLAWRLEPGVHWVWH